ncbi:MAG: RNA polymerase sigma factor (sigma-70 family) [Myxococcota bacterium]|jgi:RNA polymerase sigma factor (sigma-70 family)
MLKDRAEAEDVVQAVFVDLIGRRKTDVELGYLYRAATTRCLNRIRDRSRQVRLLKQHGDDMLRPPDTHLESQVLSGDLLTKLVASLDDRSSEILVYHHLDGMTQEEVAEMMGLSRRTIGTRLAQIKATITALEEGP